MEAEISFSTTLRLILRSSHNPFLGPRPALQIPLSLHRIHEILRRPNLSVCFILEDEIMREIREPEDEEESGEVERAILLAESVEKKIARKKLEQFTYFMAAIISSFRITFMAIVIVY
ncbi:beta-carotene 3-hydroxylase [Salvia divinorum]|uniref:beta-carotene 3-hydroxylase n=1 Tax=Salvia divinorum TaxID=28513 RepID=A0ABD1I5R0_SALDI